MSFDEITKLLSEKFGSDVIIEVQTGGLQPALIIKPDSIVPVCQ
jgi:NADH-quinone oxidoreductase subunit C